MARISQSSNKKSTQSKNARVITIAEIEFFAESMNEARAEVLADTLIEWTLINLDAKSFARFFREKGVIPYQYFRWLKEYSKLSNAHEYAKAIFAERKEKIAEEKDPKFHSNSMHIYSYEFAKDKELEHERKKELKKISDQTQKGQLTAQAIEVLKQILEPLGE